MAEKRHRNTGRSKKSSKYRIDLSPPTISGKAVKPKITAEKEPRTKERIRKSDFPSKGYSSISSEILYRYDKEISELKESNADVQKRLRNLERNLKSLGDEFDRISHLIDELKEIKSEMKEMTDVVEELSSLYDLVSADINPFIETHPLQDREEAFNNKYNREENLIELKEEEEEITRDELILQWVTFLTDKVGKLALPKVVSHYLKLGWIDEELSERTLQIAQGLPGVMKSTLNKRKELKWRLKPEDHQRSLEYIRKIREAEIN